MNYDLSVIRDKFLKDNPELSPGLEGIELLYRQYMYLCAVKPKNLLLGVPSNEVDLFWHCHILHTQLYQDFCAEIAGYFIHHDPYGASMSNQDRKISHDNLLHLFNIHFENTTFPEKIVSDCGAHFSDCGAHFSDCGAHFSDCGA
ncbi:glycine-rich domain-containing protein [Roseofilum capinflatum]|uniref:Glycine-rich domain-containing protein-like n=1 Tax=Roseofilum capinflatum BLCC-M114 TaxID=3022440 RepID=A0ABT7B653_9CYAN|nr:hypothetical protein [Roseofilum capinflatum]MDJ1174647.1 hypothetical protein [Roseofilum capinflatum BLCC-M114]